MLKGNWRGHVALGGIAAVAFLALALIHYHPKSPWLIKNSDVPSANTTNTAQDYQRAANDAFAWLRAVKKQRDADPATNESAQKAKEDENLKDPLDLAAQWVSALSADKMVTLSIWQLAFGFGGFGALIYSLVLTRRSLKTANDTVEIIRDTAAHELRPYLGIKSIDWILPQDWEKKQAIPGINIVIENFGQSPAKSATFTARVKVEIPINVAFSLEGAVTNSLGTVMPSQVVFGGQVLDYQTWSSRSTAILQGTLWVYCFGRIDYFDPISNRPRETTFRARFVPTDALDHDGRGIFVMCPDGNDAT